MRSFRGIRPTPASDTWRLGSPDTAKEAELPSGAGAPGVGADATRLERGAFVLLAYQLGQTRATGLLALFLPEGGTECLQLRGGCLATATSDPLGRQAQRRLERLAATAGMRYRFRAVAMPVATGADAPRKVCHLAAWAKAHLEAQLDTSRARQMVAELAGTRLALVSQKAPIPALCDTIDRRILAALQTPRPLHEIWHLSRTSRFRLLSFLCFLRAVGALREFDRVVPNCAPPGPARNAHTALTAGEGIVAARARRLLGVPVGADRSTVRRAYYRRVRDLHPDLHPEASAELRRHLERELTAVTTAYKRLVSIGAASALRHRE